jgi:hypothetical protein
MRRGGAETDVTYYGYCTSDVQVKKYNGGCPRRQIKGDEIVPLITNISIRRKWSGSRSGLHTPEERAPVIPGMGGGGVGWTPETVLTHFREEKSIFLVGIRTPDRAARCVVTTLTELYRPLRQQIDINQ